VDKLSEEGELPVCLCNYTDVYYNEAITLALPFMQATASADEISAFRLLPGDVLVTKDSESWDDIAVAALVKESSPDLVCGYHLAILRPDPAEISGEFLLRCLQASCVNHQFQVAATGVTRFGLPRCALRASLVPVPPLERQRDLCKRLDRALGEISALVAKKQRLIELLEEKRAAAVSRAVTVGLDPTTTTRELGEAYWREAPAHWTATRLKFVLRGIEQGWSPQCDSRVAEADEWGVLKVGCVNGCTFDEAENKALPPGLDIEERYEIRPGDVLISRANTRELVGSAALVTTVRPKLLLCDKLYRLRPGPRITPAYATLLLQSVPVRYQMECEATGASGSMQNVGQDTVRNLRVAIPPLEEQVKIAEWALAQSANFGKLAAALETTIARLREYRSALITAAVTGQLDISKHEKKMEALA
jgi:type I restriction enzyme S subunit